MISELSSESDLETEPGCAKKLSATRSPRPTGRVLLPYWELDFLPESASVVNWSAMSVKRWTSDGSGRFRGGFKSVPVCPPHSARKAGHSMQRPTSCLGSRHAQQSHRAHVMHSRSAGKPCGARSCASARVDVQESQWCGGCGCIDGASKYTKPARVDEHHGVHRWHRTSDRKPNAGRKRSAKHKSGNKILLGPAAAPPASLLGPAGPCWPAC